MRRFFSFFFVRAHNCMCDQTQVDTCGINSKTVSLAGLFDWAEVCLQLQRLSVVAVVVSDHIS